MKLLLCAATALATLSGVAYAQSNSNSGSNSNATVNTASGSQSTSVSNPRVNVIGNPIGNGASSSNYGCQGGVQKHPLRRPVGGDRQQHHSQR